MGVISTMKVSIVVAVITLVGVALTAFVTWLIAQRQILAKHVTAERAKWRKNVRAQALEVHDAILCGDGEKIGRLRSEFRALLNPFDCQDQAILKCMTVDGSREEVTEEFAGRISLLLKHDWDPLSQTWQLRYSHPSSNKIGWTVAHPISEFQNQSVVSGVALAAQALIWGLYQSTRPFTAGRSPGKPLRP